MRCSFQTKAFFSVNMLFAFSIHTEELTSDITRLAQDIHVRHIFIDGNIKTNNQTTQTEFNNNIIINAQGSSAEDSSVHLVNIPVDTFAKVSGLLAVDQNGNVFQTTISEGAGDTNSDITTIGNLTENTTLQGSELFLNSNTSSATTTYIGTGSTSGQVWIGNTSNYTNITGTTIKLNDSNGTGGAEICTGTTTGTVNIGGGANQQISLYGQAIDINTTAQTTSLVTNIGAIGDTTPQTPTLSTTTNIYGTINASSDNINITLNNTANPSPTAISLSEFIIKGLPDVTSPASGYKNLCIDPVGGYVFMTNPLTGDGGGGLSEPLTLSQLLTANAGATINGDINIGTNGNNTLTIGDSTTTEAHFYGYDLYLNNNTGNNDSWTYIGTGDTNGKVYIGNSNNNLYIENRNIFLQNSPIYDSENNLVYSHLNIGTLIQDTDNNNAYYMTNTIYGATDVEGIINLNTTARSNTSYTTNIGATGDAALQTPTLSTTTNIYGIINASSDSINITLNNTANPSPTAISLSEFIIQGLPDVASPASGYKNLCIDPVNGYVFMTNPLTGGGGGGLSEPLTLSQLLTANAGATISGLTHITTTASLLNPSSGNMLDNPTLVIGSHGDSTATPKTYPTKTNIFGIVNINSDSNNALDTINIGGSSSSSPIFIRTLRTINMNASLGINLNGIGGDINLGSVNATGSIVIDAAGTYGVKIGSASNKVSLTGTVNINQTGFATTVIGNTSSTTKIVVPAVSTGTYEYLIVDSSNNVFKTTAPIDPTLLSSARLKNNIQNLSDQDTRDIYNLKTVEFEYDERPGQKHYGLIAEDLEQIDSLKFAVRYNADGLPQSLDYNSLFVALLAEFIKLKKDYHMYKQQDIQEKADLEAKILILQDQMEIKTNKDLKNRDTKFETEEFVKFILNNFSAYLSGLTKEEWIEIFYQLHSLRKQLLH